MSIPISANENSHKHSCQCCVEIYVCLQVDCSSAHLANPWQVCEDCEHRLSLGYYIRSPHRLASARRRLANMNKYGNVNIASSWQLCITKLSTSIHVSAVKLIDTFS